MPLWPHSMAHAINDKLVIAVVVLVLACQLSESVLVWRFSIADPREEWIQPAGQSQNRFQRNWLVTSQVKYRVNLTPWRYP